VATQSGQCLRLEELPDVARAWTRDPCQPEEDLGQLSLWTPAEDFQFLFHSLDCSLHLENKSLPCVYKCSAEQGSGDRWVRGGQHGVHKKRGVSVQTWPCHQPDRRNVRWQFLPVGVTD